MGSRLGSALLPQLLVGSRAGAALLTGAALLLPLPALAAAGLLTLGVGVMGISTVASPCC